MDKDIYSDAGLKQYLLGEISDEEREQIETRYLANKDFLDQLLAVEDDLVDEYARGELSSNEREQFERKLLATPKQRQKLLRAKRLTEYMHTHSVAEARAPSREPAKISSWFSVFGIQKIQALAGGFVFLLLFVATSWLFLRERRLNAELQRMQSEYAQMQQQQQDLQIKLENQRRESSAMLQHLQTLPQTQQPKESESTPTVATFILPLTLSRGGEATSFTLHHGAEMVHLHAQVANVYKSYQAELRTADGASIYRLTKLKARRTGKGNALLLRIPAQLFKVSDYVLKVSGVADSGQLEDAGLYSFRIIRN